MVSVVYRLRFSKPRIEGVLSLCAMILSGVASGLVPTARGYALPTFRKGTQRGRFCSGYIFYRSGLEAVSEFLGGWILVLLAECKKFATIV